MVDSSHERKQKVRVRTLFTAEDSHTRASPAVNNRQFDHQEDKNGKTPKTAKTANTRIKQQEAGDEEEEGQRGPTGVGKNTGRQKRECNHGEASERRRRRRNAEIKNANSVVFVSSESLDKSWSRWSSYGSLEGSRDPHQSRGGRGGTLSLNQANG